MAILSMTGFGRGTYAILGREYSAELRSVNHRYLDVRIKLPRFLAQAEQHLREMVAARLERGRVELTIHGNGQDDSPLQSLTIDESLASRVFEVHESLAERFGVPMSLDTRALAMYPGVVRSVSDDFDEDRQREIATRLVNSALDKLVEMRQAEGAKLDSLLRGHLDVLRENVSAIEVAVPEIRSAYRSRLESRIRDVLAEVNGTLDEQRVLHEVGIFADRSDIAEEVERLEAHFEHFERLLAIDNSEAVGRRMDFLCQEMLRETNTIGSKAQAIQLTERVVSIKSELERLREQVQNVE